MVIFYRAAAILVEVSILVAITYAFLAGAYLTLFDLGLDLKYQRFIKRALTIMGCLALIFYISHLITFYPKISP